MARPTWAQRNGIVANAWREARARALARANGRCEIGGPGCRGVAVEVDHIIPVRLGGSKYDSTNLRASCAHCNRVLGARLGAKARDANTFRRGYVQALRDNGLA
jgi:5-methylcytosine-specific restriction endonuclease McrA